MYFIHDWFCSIESYFAQPNHENIPRTCEVLDIVHQPSSSTDTKDKGELSSDEKLGDKELVDCIRETNTKSNHGAGDTKAQLSHFQYAADHAHSADAIISTPAPSRHSNRHNESLR